MNRSKLIPAVCAALMLLAGCNTAPQGPTVAVMPAPNKPFEVFQQDQQICTQFAQDSIGNAQQQLNNQQFATAAVTTVLGAGLGAAIGGGRGAAIGAGSGALLGTSYGANQTAYQGANMQHRYDIAYSQCMYARGNQVPGFAPPQNSPYPPPPPPQY